MAMQRRARLQTRLLGWLAAAAQRTTGVILSRHEDLVRALPGAKGHSRRRRQTLEARAIMALSL